MGCRSRSRTTPFGGKIRTFIVQPPQIRDTLESSRVYIERLANPKEKEVENITVDSTQIRAELKGDAEPGGALKLLTKMLRLHSFHYERI